MNRDDLRAKAEAARDAIAAHAALNEDEPAERRAYARMEEAVEALREAVTADVVLALLGVTMTDATVDPAALRAKALADWQHIRYGDTDATRAALAYYRERGWRVDDPNFTRDTEVIEARIYAFTSGYEAAYAALLSERDALMTERDEARAERGCPHNGKCSCAIWTSTHETAMALYDEVGKRKQAEAERDALAAQVAALECALRNRGHDAECTVHRDPRDCDCGLALVDAAPPAPEGQK